MSGTGPEGSLRRVAASKGVPLLVFEGGEPFRFNKSTIEMGVNGSLRVMAALNMIDEEMAPKGPASMISKRTGWIRARQSGILRLSVGMGEFVKKGDRLGVIADPFGGRAVNVVSNRDGIIIGRVIQPLVHKGDAVLHLAEADAGPTRVDISSATFE